MQSALDIVSDVPRSVTHRGFPKAGAAHAKLDARIDD